MLKSEDLKIGDEIIVEGQAWEFEPRRIIDIWPVPIGFYNSRVQRKLILDNGVGIDDWNGRTYHTPEDYSWLPEWLAARNNKRSAGVTGTGRARNSKRA